MGLTKEQAERLQQRVDKLANKPSAILGSLKVRANGNTKARPTTMNKLEARYDRHLAFLMRSGRIAWYAFQPVRLQLATLTTLTMDFMVMFPDGRIEFHDTKAYYKKQKTVHIEDDAAVKMKVAAEKYFMFTFKVVWEADGSENWNERTY